MPSTPNEGSIPSIPDETSVNLIPEDVSLAQVLFQENQQLREQIAGHTQLLQLLTHQLATPLTTLNGSIQLLTDPALATEQRKEFLEVIEQQIRRLKELLHDMMALRDLETGKFDTQPVRFCIREAIAEALTDFATYPITYQFSESLPPVWADRWQVLQILINLLSNAVKYSPEGKAVEIGATVVQPGWVEVWVQDQGLGIPESDQGRLFERFYRVKHRDRQHISGTGLGLSLCKLLVENQGGQIHFESKHGQGSCFRFTLPTAETADR